MYRMMEETPGMFILLNQNNITDTFMRDNYEKINTKYSITRSSLIFSNPNSKPEDWFLSAFSKSLKISMILCKFSESYTDDFPPVNMNNRPQASKWTHINGLNSNKMAKHIHHVGTTITDSSSGTSNLTYIRYSSLYMCKQL